jgi:hypothetical protein
MDLGLYSAARAIESLRPSAHQRIESALLSGDRVLARAALTRETDLDGDVADAIIDLLDAERRARIAAEGLDPADEDDADLIDDIQTCLREASATDAVALYAVRTHLDLVSAADAVASIAAGKSPLADANDPHGVGMDGRARIDALLAGGDREEAIEFYHAATGLPYDVSERAIAQFADSGTLPVFGDAAPASLSCGCIAAIAMAIAAMLGFVALMTGGGGSPRPD